MIFFKIILRSFFYSVLMSVVLFHSNVSAKEQIKNLEKIKEVVSKHLGITSIFAKLDIKPSPIKGLYQVVVPPKILYISEDANYVFEGDIINTKTNENYTEDARNAAHFAAVDAFKDSMIIFSPKGKVKHTISVFTDMDCYYCQKLHKEISEYNRLGIEVRYLAYPRQGLQSPSYRKAVSVWCSKDQKAALTKAKNGEVLEEKTCANNPVKKHFALGKALGIGGTPAIILENGQLYPGYIPAARLSAGLEQMKAQVANAK